MLSSLSNDRISQDQCQFESVCVRSVVASHSLNNIYIFTCVYTTWLLRCANGLVNQLETNIKRIRNGTKKWTKVKDIFLIESSRQMELYDCALPPQECIVVICIQCHFCRSICIYVVKLKRHSAILILDSMIRTCTALHLTHRFNRFV